MEISEVFNSPGTMDASFAGVLSSLLRGNVPFVVVVRIVLSGRLMSIGVVLVILVRQCLSISRMKCDDAPLSLLAMTDLVHGRIVIFFSVSLFRN